MDGKKLQKKCFRTSGGPSGPLQESCRFVMKDEVSGTETVEKSSVLERLRRENLILPDDRNRRQEEHEMQHYSIVAEAANGQKEAAAYPEGELKSLEQQQMCNLCLLYKNSKIHHEQFEKRKKKKKSRVYFLVGGQNKK